MGAGQHVPLVEHPRHGLTPFQTRIGFAKDLVEAGIEDPAALPVEQEVHHDAAEGVAVFQALARFGQIQHARGDDRLRRLDHARRKLRAGGGAERLAEDALGRVEDVRRKRVREVGHHERIRRKRYAAFIDAHAQAEPALHGVVSGRQVGKGDGARPLRTHAIPRRRGLAREDGAKFDGLGALQHSAADAAAGERDADKVRGRYAGVHHRDRRVVGLAETDCARMGEGEGEPGIADQHGAGGPALHPDDSRSQPVEIGGEVEIHDVEAFLQSFHEELALPRFTRLQTRDVVGRAQLSIRTGAHDGLHRLDFLAGTDPREPERIIAGLSVVRAREPVGSGWKDELRLDVLHAQSGARGRAVLGEYLHAEELVQEADVAGDDHERGDGRDPQGQILFAHIDPLEIDALDLDVELRLRELRRKHGAGGNFLVDQRRRDQTPLKFGRRNDLRVAVEARGDHGEFHGDAFAIEHESDLELHRPEIILIDRDTLLLDLVRRQRPRRDTGDEHLVEDVDRNRRRTSLQFHLARRRVDEPDAVELVVADKIERGQEQGRIDGGHEASRIHAGTAQRGLDVGVRDRDGAVRPGRTRKLDEHRSGDALRHRKHGRRNPQLRADDPVFEGGQRSGGRQESRPYTHDRQRREDQADQAGPDIGAER